MIDGDVSEINLEDLVISKPCVRCYFATRVSVVPAELYLESVSPRKCVCVCVCVVKFFFLTLSDRSSFTPTGRVVYSDKLVVKDNSITKYVSTNLNKNLEGSEEQVSGAGWKEVT